MLFLVCVNVSRNAGVDGFGTSHANACRSSHIKLRVLTRKEERKLFVLVSRCTAHSVVYRGKITPDVLHSLASAMSISDVAAQTIIDQACRAHGVLLRFNVRLAASMAHKHARPGVSVATLLSEATQGLSDAIDRFDLSRGFAFSSFAFHYIFRDIQKCIVDQSRLIALPQDAHYMVGKLVRAKENLIARLPVNQREAFRDELSSNPEVLRAALASELEVSEEAVARVLKAGLPTFDIDAPVYDDESWLEHHTAQTLGSEDDEVDGAHGDFEAEMQRQVMLNSLDSVLSTLDTRERNILRLRYGLNAERRVMKLSEVASAYNLTPERVRQISDAAIRKLSKPWRVEFLEEHGEGLL